MIDQKFKKEDVEYHQPSYVFCIFGAYLMNIIQETCAMCSANGIILLSVLLGPYCHSPKSTVRQIVGTYQLNRYICMKYMFILNILIL